MTSDLLRIPVTLALDCNGRPSAEVGGCRVLLNANELPPHIIKMLTHLDAVARDQFARAQTGPQPSHGAMYPEGSQGKAGL